MAKKRLHHFIPQFHLRGFANPSENHQRKSFLWVYTIYSGLVDQRTPRAIAAESGYFAIDTALGRDYETLENELATMENQAASALRRMLSRPVGSRSAIEPEISAFIAWLACRVPWFKRIAMEGWPRYLNDMAWGKEPVEHDSIISVLMVNQTTGEERRFPLQLALAAIRSRHWVAQIDQNQVLDMMRLPRWHFQHEHFPRLFWTILTAPQGDSFITSDRPVVWYVPGKGFANSPAALKEPNVELTVPLNRNNALLATASPPPVGTSIGVNDIDFRTRCFAERFVASAEATKLADERACFS